MQNNISPEGRKSKNSAASFYPVLLLLHFIRLFRK